MIRWLRSIFAWHVLYKNAAWTLWANKVTGERQWHRQPGCGYIPLPMIDDEGRVIAMAPPPSRSSR